MKCLVGIDRQHVGQPSKRWAASLGASADVDGDGKKEIWEAEAFWTAKYGFHMEQTFHNLDDYHVIPFADGFYTTRHHRMNEYQDTLKYPKNVYLALHANAGGGNYGLWLYDSRSTKGRALAQSIANEVQKEFPHYPQKIRSCSATDWSNAFYCIRGVKAVAICCEPWFLDNQKHVRDYMNEEGMKKLGYAIAMGVEKWKQK